MFGEYYSSIYDRIAKGRWKSPQAYYTHMLNVPPCDSLTPPQLRHTQCRFQLEMDWHNSRRPYYLVYPAIAKALIAANYTGVDVSTLDIPHQPVELRFAQPIDGFSCCLATIIHIDDRAVPYYYLNEVDHEGDKMFVGGCGDETDSQLNPLIIGIALLAQDTQWLVPEPLKADMDKYESSGDARYIDKAQRRGKVCYSLGKQIETAAHIRRPHFAVRWMKPDNARPYIGTKADANGRDTVPVLRPVRGSVVQRERVRRVPTAYRDTLQGDNAT